MKKSFLAISLLATSMLLAGCSFKNILDNSNSDNSGNTNSNSGSESTPTGTAEWTLMFYVCGADLESEDFADDPNYTQQEAQEYGYGNTTLAGYASRDIDELLAVSKPNNVNIILETGGCKNWAKSEIPSNKLGRWHVANGKLVNDSKETIASMGLSTTFQSFLEWGFKSYPAKKYGVFMWNHGGAMDGCCFDERYSNDSLTADEVDTALTKAKNNQHISGNLEFIAYDACLMAVQDIAEVNSHHFNYMVCSQESEYAGGYDYDAWLPTLYADPANVSALTICNKIADTFIAEQNASADEYNNYYGLKPSDDDYWPQDQTQSVLDLSKMAAYKTAFDNFSTGLAGIITSKSKWNSFASLLKGSNVQKYGYDGSQNYDYVYDIYNLAGTKGVLTAMKSGSTYSSISTQITALETALNNLVVHKINGKEIYGCGLCLAAPANGWLYKPTYQQQTNFDVWYSLCSQYGNWYSNY